MMEDELEQKYVFSESDSRSLNFEQNWFFIKFTFSEIQKLEIYYFLVFINIKSKKRKYKI
jgi:hypothetical protein